MPVKGIKRYTNLYKNINNPEEYIFNKSKRSSRPLKFSTKPNRINFEVPETLYQVFKEIFMEDVYGINELVKKLPNKPVVIDIGANAGFFDILLLSKITEAIIFAYEPIVSNTLFFKKIMMTNPAMNKSIRLEQMAVTGTEKESIELFLEDTPNNQVVASVFSDFNKENKKKTIVPCISLSKIVRQHKLTQIDLLKMDCEGSEYDIIYNSSPDIIQLATNIAIEVHDVDEKRNNFSNLKNYLESLNYHITYTPINNFCYAVDATKIY